MRATGPAGTRAEWTSEVVEDQPNELIAWQTTGDSELYHWGKVTFRPGPRGDGTVVDVDDLARKAVERGVGRFVLPLVGVRRKQPIAARRLGAQRFTTSPVSMFSRSRAGPMVCMASKPCSTMSQ